MPQKIAPAQAEILRNPRAVREAKLELTRDLLHESPWLGAYLCSDSANVC
jgi:hypothetical protein